MKAKLLFSVLFLLLFQFGYSQQRSASLEVDFSETRMLYTFQIGNESFQANRNLIVQELRSGFHPVQIYEHRRNRKYLVYNGGINLARNATTFSYFENGNFEVTFIEPYIFEEEEVIIPIIPEELFFQLKSSVKNESFDSGKIELLETTIKHHNFNSYQIKELMTLLTFDSGRLEFAKAAYTRVVDPENYFLVREALSYSSSKSELTDYINSLSEN
tara:strand:- start:49494 stop:50141 length:648 start_codon:yes stop_codon:yes gene_type:complete